MVAKLGRWLAACFRGLPRLLARAAADEEEEAAWEEVEGREEVECERDCVAVLGEEG